MAMALNRGKVRERICLLELKHWWVAETVGVHPSTLKRWLNGRINATRYNHVDRLARVLGLSSDEILTK